MSTFNGEIREISGISVDHFENNKQKCYFLSHCHSDHQKGLYYLKTDAPVYTTSISALFIQKKFPNLVNNIKVLELGITSSIELVNKENNETTQFSVTALSAGHCAGACMFLFQVEGRDILYTGDFRMSLKNAKNIKILEEVKSHKKTTIYLDSTFLKTSFPHFPTQTESVMKIKEIVKHFLDKSENHKVFLHVPARYGYEYLLMELSLALNEKIFIHEQNVYEQYIFVSRLDSCVTRDRHRSRIFLELKFLNIPVDPKEDPAHRLDLHLSAMIWTNWNQETSFVNEIGPNNLRVCYATHNSYNEIKDFLMFLKPENINLNVLPDNVEEKAEMLRQLALIQSQFSNITEEIRDVEEVQTTRKFSFKRVRSMVIENSVEKKLKL